MISIAKPMISGDEIEEVIKVLKSGYLTSGDKVEEFEKNFSDYCGCKHGIATSSGTSALHTALLSLGVGKGDEVITTPFSFIASSNCILFVGAKPVFVDIKAKTYNIDVDLIEEKITERTKAIIPIHLYGQPCDMGRIMKIAKEYGLSVVEDACQAHGAEFKDKKVGSFGDVACFSFYLSKNMTTGEGGMITTDSDEIADKCRRIINHGQEKKYYHIDLGFNFRMMNIQAAIGVEQLKKLDRWNGIRRENAKFLTEQFEDLSSLTTPFVDPRVKHVFHQYTIRVKKMNNFELSKKLAKKGIETRIYYPLPIHKQSLYQKLGYKDHLPEAELAAKEVLSLPVHPGLSEQDLKKIVREVRGCLG